MTEPGTPPRQALSPLRPSDKDSAWQCSLASPSLRDAGKAACRCLADATCTADATTLLLDKWFAAQEEFMTREDCCGDAGLGASSGGQETAANSPRAAEQASQQQLREWEVPAEFAPHEYARHREPLASGGFSTVYRQGWQWFSEFGFVLKHLLLAIRELSQCCWLAR